MNKETIIKCEKIIGHKFKNPELLEHALTHSSAKRINGDANERLEFLGDAVLGLVISEYLYEKFPEYQEGELTRIKSAAVSRNALADATSELGIMAFVSIGKGLAMKAKIPVSVLANVYEGIVAAIYFDGGLEPARKFCLKTLKTAIKEIEKKQVMRNYKSLLQQYAQQKKWAIPKYSVASVRGPEHLKAFKIEVKVNEKKYKGLWAQSKKEAEQHAAQKALEALALELPDDEDLNDFR